MLVIALARPQSVVSVPRVEGTVILAFDVSGSMAADDLEPTRMEAAKDAARTFVERQPTSILIGVVAFSDSGFSIQVPTSDQPQVLAAIDRLAPERGTSLGRGILTSLTTIAAAEADPAEGYYTNRIARTYARPDACPGRDVRAGRDRPADRRREQPVPGSPRGRRGRGGSWRADLHGRDRERGGIDARGRGLQGPQPPRRADAPTDRSDHRRGLLRSRPTPTSSAPIYDRIDTRLVVQPEAMEVTSLFAGAGVLVLLVGAVASLTWLDACHERLGDDARMAGGVA